ncbi:hypothetical protein BC826DRAFT_1189011, partial [Russula brevipes]
MAVVMRRKGELEHWSRVRAQWACAAMARVVGGQARLPASPVVPLHHRLRRRPRKTAAPTTPQDPATCKSATCNTRKCKAPTASKLSRHHHRSPSKAPPPPSPALHVQDLESRTHRALLPLLTFFPLIEQALTDYGSRLAAIVAQAFRFVYARFRAWWLGQAEEMETWLGALAVRDLEDIMDLVWQRSRVTFEHLTLLFARAMALHFAARAVDDQ